MEAVRTSRLSDENFAELTAPLWPFSVRTHVPSAASQILVVQSSEAVTTRRLSGEKEAELTSPLWPLSVRTH
eukprot:12451348-Alexandrium_andersonii.AAC.1